MGQRRNGTPVGRKNPVGAERWASVKDIANGTAVDEQEGVPAFVFIPQRVIGAKANVEVGDIDARMTEERNDTGALVNGPYDVDLFGRIVGLFADRCYLCAQR